MVLFCLLVNKNIYIVCKLKTLIALFGHIPFIDGNTFVCLGSSTQIKYAIYGLLIKREVEMAGYWPSFLLRVYGLCSINSHKKNEANMQPS